ncbi:MAG: hypothetical protein R3E68_15065 [Burkholderiaceae bacterium]
MTGTACSNRRARQCADGKGLANPVAMFLSTAMMLDWLGERHQADALTAAGRAIVEVVDKVFAAARCARPTSAVATARPRRWLR